MKYRNTKTGQLIEVSSRITGGYWEPIESEKVAKKPEEKPAKKTTRKKA